MLPPAGQPGPMQELSLSRNLVLYILDVFLPEDNPAQKGIKYAAKKAIPKEIEPIPFADGSGPSIKSLYEMFIKYSSNFEEKFKVLADLSNKLTSSYWGSILPEADRFDFLNKIISVFKNRPFPNPEILYSRLNLYIESYEQKLRSMQPQSEQPSLCGKILNDAGVWIDSPPIDEQNKQERDQRLRNNEAILHVVSNVVKTLTDVLPGIVVSAINNIGLGIFKKLDIGINTLVSVQQNILTDAEYGLLCRYQPLLKFEKNTKDRKRYSIVDFPEDDMAIIAAQYTVVEAVLWEERKNLTWVIDDPALSRLWLDYSEAHLQALATRKDLFVQYSNSKTKSPKDAARSDRNSRNTFIQKVGSITFDFISQKLASSPVYFERFLHRRSDNNLLNHLGVLNRLKDGSYLKRYLSLSRFAREEDYMLLDASLQNLAILSKRVVNDGQPVLTEEQVNVFLLEYYDAYLQLLENRKQACEDAPEAQRYAGVWNKPVFLLQFIKSLNATACNAIDFLCDTEFELKSADIQIVLLRQKTAIVRAFDSFDVNKPLAQHANSFLRKQNHNFLQALGKIGETSHCPMLDVAPIEPSQAPEQRIVLGEIDERNSESIIEDGLVAQPRVSEDSVSTSSQSSNIRSMPHLNGIGKGPLIFVFAIGAVPWVLSAFFSAAASRLGWNTPRRLTVNSYVWCEQQWEAAQQAPFFGKTPLVALAVVGAIPWVVLTLFSGVAANFGWNWPKQQAKAAYFWFAEQWNYFSENSDYRENMGASVRSLSEEAQVNDVISLAPSPVLLRTSSLNVASITSQDVDIEIPKKTLAAGPK